MAFADRINESIRGRNLGFEFLSSGKHGTQKTGKLLVGPEAAREYHSTGETTGTNMPAFGVSVLNASSAGSSQVYVLDPPIPGLTKKLVFNSTIATLYARTANASEVIVSSGTSAATVIKSTQNVIGFVHALAVTTAMWVLEPISTASFALAATT